MSDWMTDSLPGSLPGMYHEAFLEQNWPNFLFFLGDRRRFEAWN